MRWNPTLCATVLRQEGAWYWQLWKARWLKQRAGGNKRRLESKEKARPRNLCQPCYTFLNYYQNKHKNPKIQKSYYIKLKKGDKKYSKKVFQNWRINRHSRENSKIIGEIWYYSRKEPRREGHELANHKGPLGTQDKWWEPTTKTHWNFRILRTKIPHSQEGG